MSLASPLLHEFLFSWIPDKSLRFPVPLRVFSFCSLFLLYFCRADHCLCAAHFRFVRLGWRGFAFTCFTLPRRHCAPTSTRLGHHSERLDDQLLGHFLSLFTLLLSIWVASAFRFALIGMAVGGILGVLGLTLSRWESRPEGLFYTPSRWLAFIIVFAIAARVLYGWWRATHPSSGGAGDQHWLITTSGTQLSLAIAAGLIGYYLVYSIGVRSFLARYEQRRE